MEGMNRVMLLLACTMLAMFPEASATRWIVGDNMGWTTNFNYTTWAKGKHFYNGDWLFFVYDRHQLNVLEVNKTNYETCNYDRPLYNWTTGAGRDVVPLNVTGTHYFVSGKGFCYSGLKMAIHVENMPPPPVGAPRKDEGAATLPLKLDSDLSVIGAAWDAFIHYICQMFDSSFILVKVNYCFLGDISD